MTKENTTPTKWYETMTLKMFLLGTMAILFLIPLQLIKIVIREREQRSHDVINEISEQWGKTQTITGPVLNIPVYRTVKNQDKETEPVMRVWHILPETLAISGELLPEVRSRGIYETVIYSSSLKVNGSFSIPKRGKDNYNILWDEAYLTMGISDKRGLFKQVHISINNSEISAEPGLVDMDLFTSGLSFPIILDEEKKEMEFSLNLNLKGSEGIYFTPVGKATSVSIN